MLEVKNLSACYGRQKVLDGINLTFEKGRFYCIVGRNSSGKSTLVNCLGSLMKHDGEILLDGKRLSEMSLNDRAKKISLLSQSVKNVPFTVDELIGFGRNPYGDIKGIGRKLAEKAMAQAGVSHLKEKRVDMLSGGEIQLSYFAMNLCQDADIMILDEPTSSLDVDFSQKILEASKQKCREGKTVICVIHNLSDAVKYADEVIILDKGKCSFSGTKEKCLAECAIEKNFGVKKFISDTQIFFSV